MEQTPGLNKPNKILLVDDREENLVSLEAILGAGGYELHTATSGTRALKILLADTDFCLILMDVEMPEINGFETASMIYSRERLRHIPIIFVTAHTADEELMFQGYRTGAVDYIFKPINADLLKAKVSVFVDLHNKTQQLKLQEQNLLQNNLQLEDRVNERTQELQRKNDELERKNADLERVNNDLDNFMYTASHDLKGPLGNLQILVEMLTTQRADQATEKEMRLLNLMKTSLDKFARTIKDLTAVTNVQRDMGGPKEEVKIPELADDIKADLQPLVRETGAVIVEDYEVEEVSYARKNIRSILYNLISNAIKYRAPDRPPRVEVRTFRRGNRSMLTVQDNGLGLNPEQQSKLFTMFKRLHTHVEGSGIGLYMIKKIVENNGGKIEVESQEGIGTRFTVYLN